MKTIHHIISNGPQHYRSWVVRHQSAIHRGLTQTAEAKHPALGGMDFTHSIVQGINAWNAYAINHQARYNSPIGQDYVLGPTWQQWGLALRTLLNGETGDLDCGTLDTIIYDNLKEQFPAMED